MHLPERSSAVATMGVAAIVGVVAWFFIRTERSDAFAVAACVQLYKKAASRSDTIRIDGQVPLQREKGQLNPLTCSALRSAYPTRFVGDSAQRVARAPRELLLGRWRACFLLDSTATSRRPAIHTTCGTITVRSLGDSVPRTGRPVLPDSMRPDVVLGIEHDLVFSSLLGREPGIGPTGSGTVLSRLGHLTIRVNARAGSVAWDDGSIIAQATLITSDSIVGRWSLSCLPGCPEAGDFSLRRGRR